MFGTAKVIIVGNITKDPKVNKTQSGKTICELAVAINRPADQPTIYISTVCFGKIAENCGKYLKKGSAVIINGNLSVNSWQDKNTGEKKERLIIQASDVQFVNGSSNSANSDNSNNEPEFEPPPANNNIWF